MRIFNFIRKILRRPVRVISPDFLYITHCPELPEKWIVEYKDESGKVCRQETIFENGEAIIEFKKGWTFLRGWLEYTTSYNGGE